MDAIYRTVASILFSIMSALGIQMPPATWELHPALDGRTVSLTFSDHPHSSHGATIAIDDFEGLRPLLKANGPARFRLKRDAGVFEFDGVIRMGVGGGTMEFMPSETFATELAKRGFEKPSRIDQLKMAWHDTGFALIDELAAHKYQRLTLQQLVNAGDHAIDRVYVRQMSAAGYDLGSVDALVRQHDHGVDAKYIGELASLGLKGLSADNLVRARDHGVSPDYVRDMAALGYKTLTIDDLVTGRDHGIGPEYVRDLSALGYRGVALPDLVRMRDHGVNPAWLRVVNTRNRGMLSIDQLVSLRDHGVETLEELRRKRGA